MPAKLSTTFAKIALVPNKVNAGLIQEYHRYLQDNGASERHQNNTLKAVLAYANHLGRSTTFFDIKGKDQIMAYLDRFVKKEEEDPEKKWITTWNDICHRIKHEFYVNWIIERLAFEGVVCRPEKIGPNIQISSTSTAINVETGTSDVRGNIRKALQSFQKVIVCSDDKKLIQSLSDEIRTQNVRCALVQDVIDVYHSMQTNAADSIR